MRKFTLALLAGATVAVGAGAASAQGVWLPMIEREAAVRASVDAGLAAGELTPAEARAIRADMGALVGLEARYRSGGLSARERLDLDRRYALVHDRLQVAAADVDPVDAVSLASFEERKDRLEARIRAGEDDGRLTTAEADDLRTELIALDRMAARMRGDGLVTLAERDVLQRRLDTLANEYADASGDPDRVYGLR